MFRGEEDDPEGVSARIFHLWKAYFIGDDRKLFESSSGKFYPLKINCERQIRISFSCFFSSVNRLNVCKRDS